MAKKKKVITNEELHNIIGLQAEFDPVLKYYLEGLKIDFDIKQLRKAVLFLDTYRNLKDNKSNKTYLVGAAVPALLGEEKANEFRDMIYKEITDEAVFARLNEMVPDVVDIESYYEYRAELAKPEEGPEQAEETATKE